MSASAMFRLLTIPCFFRGYVANLRDASSHKFQSASNGDPRASEKAKKR